VPAVPLCPAQSVPSLRQLPDGHSMTLSTQAPMPSQAGVIRLSLGQVVTPQAVPSAWLPLSTHRETPVEHDVVPVLHLFVGLHGCIATQLPHVPE